MNNPFDKPLPDRPARVAGGVVVLLLLVLLVVRGAWVAGHLKSLAPVAGGDPAPAFQLPLLGGGDFTLGAADGQVTVLDFFATWCEPCRAALPRVDALARRYQGRARVVAVDVEDKDARRAVEQLATNLGLSLPIALSGEDVGGLYKVSSLPTTVLVGKDGSIRKVLLGIHSEEELARLIDRALAE